MNDLIQHSLCTARLSAPSLLIAGVVTLTGTALGPAAFAAPTLTGRAVLPAETFAPGPISGTLLGTDPINGVTVPFQSQPVQGFSGALDRGDGSFDALEDNGYGAKGNSGDFNLRVYRVRPNFHTAGGGTHRLRLKTSWSCPIPNAAQALPSRTKRRWDAL